MTSATFDHLTDGTPATAWDDLVRAARDAPPPGYGDRLVALAAHPDDESLGAGGLIAASAAAGAEVTVVVASDGEASHPGSPTHARDRMAARRRDEVRAAVPRLAPQAQVVLLGLPDGGLATRAGDLRAALEPLVAGCSHLVTPWAGDRHPDHEACGQVGAELAGRHGARHWQYPIWAWHWADPHAGTLRPDRLRAVRLTGEARSAKAAALRCHASQRGPLSGAPGDEPILPPRMLEHFARDAELFVVEPREQVDDRYFDDLYTQDPDPWGLGERFYERRKRAVLLGALTRPAFRRGFEPGCATGRLTTELARRCDALVAWDAADAAVAQAADRVSDQPHVEVSRGTVPDQWPDGRFDLVVLSEVGYYCDDLWRLADRVDSSLRDDGVLIACHWRHPAPLHPHSAGSVHAVIGAAHRLVVSHVEDDFLLQVWNRDGVSVAAADGVVS